MALEKSLDTGYGISLEYHRISRVRWEKANQNTVLLDFESFVSHQARLDGMQPVWRSTATFEVEEVDLRFETLYGLLAAYPLFEGAQSA
jgi:hypothetical protein